MSRSFEILRNHQNATCEDLTPFFGQGDKYKCSCDDGFYYTFNDTLRNGECRDINECATNSHNCDHNCININGSYYCSCDEDFKLIGDFKCEKMESIQNDFAALPVTNDGKIEAPSMNQDRDA